MENDKVFFCVLFLVGQQPSLNLPSQTIISQQVTSQVGKRELEFKMVVTVCLQDISSMYITLETSYVFILYVYYLRIKLSGFCQRRPLTKGTMAATNITRYLK